MVGTPRKDVFVGEPEQSEDEQTDTGDDGLDDRVDDDDDDDKGDRRPNDPEFERVLIIATMSVSSVQEESM